MSYGTNREVGDGSSTAGMFTYPSSPLFEQPFANRDFYADQTPLRSRNAGSSSGQSVMGGGENDAFFAPKNPYFTTPQRRKRSFHQFSPDRWVRQVMRLVLLSPLIVLVLWSVSAVFLAPSASSSAARQAAQLKKQPKAQAIFQKQQQQQNRRKRGTSQQTQQSGTTSTKAKEYLEEGLLEVVELSGDLLGEAQPPQLTRAQAGSLQSQPQVGQTLPQQRPLIPVVNPLGATMPQTESRAAHLVHSMEHSVGQYFHQNSPSKQLNMLPSSHNNLIVQPQHLMAQTPNLRGSTNQKKVAYYFYDPRATLVGQDGQLYLPNVVYDQAGNALDTNSIGRGGATQVFIQPPPPMGATSSSSTTSSVTSNTTDSSSEPELARVLPVQDPAKGISFPSKNDITEAVQRAEADYQENGSSVIVATVAVMALLVGALSARKLRGRASILNSCIENERLDHMSLVDDTATETNNTAYSTFHWKGDLEKFDV